MEEQSVRQMQGVVELLRDAAVATSHAIGEAHARIANVPYAVLKRIPLVRGPSGRIESIQLCITAVFYASFRTISVRSAFVATQALGTLGHKTAEK